MLFLYFLICTLLAEPMTIVVEDYSNLAVYISDPVILNVSEDTEGIIGSKSAYGYNSTYWKNAKVKNERGIYVPILSKTIFKVYDKDTIGYGYDNCNYEADAKKCSYQNNHHLVETYITIDTHETVVQMILYNPDMTILNVANISDRGEINYIKQQQVNMSMRAASIEVTILPEEKPLKWVIPAHLFDKYIQQAAAGLWMGVKIQ